jgi:hypothetical protein
MLMETNADEREGVMPSKPADRLDGTDFNFSINTSVLFDRGLSQPTSTQTRLGVVSLGREINQGGYPKRHCGVFACPGSTTQVDLPC